MKNQRCPAVNAFMLPVLCLFLSNSPSIDNSMRKQKMEAFLPSLRPAFYYFVLIYEYFLSDYKNSICSM